MRFRNVSSPDAQPKERKIAGACKSRMYYVHTKKANIWIFKRRFLLFSAGAGSYTTRRKIALVLGTDSRGI